VKFACATLDVGHLYKKKFTGVTQEFEELKRSLVEDGRLRKVSARSARAVKPHFL
jgi:hypothetical protein